MLVDWARLGWNMERECTRETVRPAILLFILIIILIIQTVLCVDKEVCAVKRTFFSGFPFFLSSANFPESKEDLTS